jgi:AbiU2
MMGGRDKIAELSLSERIKAAKTKTASVVDHLLYLVELHENNALVLYSPLLSSQIPTSHAANAFNVFQRGLHQIELVRLCALWDGIEPEKENVPTIVELIDRPEVVDALAAETAAHWKGIGTGGLMLDPTDDPALQALAADAFQRSNEEFGEQQGQEARASLRKAIDDAREIAGSARLQSIINLRDKHLAHSLTQTRREQKVGPIAPMKYGDERAILDGTLPIVEALYCWINGCGFSFNDSREIDRKNAKALWENCKFSIDY